jgi:hypothetical protein
LHVLGTPPALILSQDQTLKLNSLIPPKSRRSAEGAKADWTGHNSSNVDSLLIWLSNVVQFVKCEVVRDPPGAELRPRSGNASRHPLILDGRPPSPFGLWWTSACTFYLVFKEPELPGPPEPLGATATRSATKALAREVGCRLGVPLRRVRRLGNLTILQKPPDLVNPSRELVNPSRELFRNLFRRTSLCGILAIKKLLGSYLKQFFRPPGRVTLGKPTISAGFWSVKLVGPSTRLTRSRRAALDPVQPL